MTYSDALALLQDRHQEHLLKYYDELSEEEQEALLRQIASIDFSILDNLKEENRFSENRGHFEPLPALQRKEILEKEASFRETGLQALREGKTATVLLAGGQGTRLGFDHPKGMYNIGETRDLYIFECLINNLMDVVREAGAFVPLYIMCSEINREETEAFFIEKNYFGYDPSYIRFFVQDMAPCVGYDGKILLESKGKIAVSPNGNGGWFNSLVKAGLLPDLHARGVEYISAFSVDNVCQRINDPVFVGAVFQTGTDCGAKAVAKADPNERIGVLCLEDGRPAIVEYYEMTEDMVNLRDSEGTLLYNYGVILNYMFRLSSLEGILEKPLPVHVVEKKVPCLDESGCPVRPEKANACKFELLILDMIHILRTCLPYEIDRTHEFAPIKNAEGVDSVISARELLRKNGVTL